MVSYYMHTTQGWREGGMGALELPAMSFFFFLPPTQRSLFLMNEVPLSEFPVDGKKKYCIVHIYYHAFFVEARSPAKLWCQQLQLEIQNNKRMTT